MRSLKAFAFVLFCSVTIGYAADKPREKIGEVLGKPVYRDQLGSTKSSAVFHLFAGPSWERYRKDNKKKLEPTEQEIKAILDSMKRMADAQKPKIEARLAEVKKKLSEPSLEKSERQKFETRRTFLEIQLKPFHRKFAVWYLSKWKRERLLYD